MQKTFKMTETLAYGYSSESTQQELSNEYQHDRVLMVFKNICILVLRMKVALALEGLMRSLSAPGHTLHQQLNHIQCRLSMLTTDFKYICRKCHSPRNEGLTSLKTGSKAFLISSDMEAALNIHLKNNKVKQTTLE